MRGAVRRWGKRRAGNGVVWGHLFLVEIEVGHGADRSWRRIRVCRDEQRSVERSLTREHGEDGGKLLRRDN